jgi:hypothetical protein
VSALVILPAFLQFKKETFPFRFSIHGELMINILIIACHINCDLLHLMNTMYNCIYMELNAVLQLLTMYSITSAILSSLGLGLSDVCGQLLCILLILWVLV